MPEGESTGLAHDPIAHEAPVAERRGWEELIEIAEVIVLAIVAVATAWSGFQSAKWDGRQSALYATVNRYGFQADAATAAGGQELSADAAIFTAWLQAASAHDGKLAAIYVRRFTPGYRAAFLAWLRADPLTNPAAPPGPAAMPQYHNPGLQAAARLRQQASAAFAQGSAARDTSERYLRGTVLFALVLFLVAIAQRFKLRNIRIATNALALGLLVYAAIWVAELPRA